MQIEHASNTPFVDLFRPTVSFVHLTVFCPVYCRRVYLLTVLLFCTVYCAEYHPSLLKVGSKSKLSFIGHSMGGLIIRAALQVLSVCL